MKCLIALMIFGFVIKDWIPGMIIEIAKEVKDKKGSK